MNSIELAKQLAWVVTSNKVSGFGPIRATVKNFYSGSRAISDPELMSFIKKLPHISDMIYNYDVIPSFEKAFSPWLTNHSSNKIIGLENFEADLSQGATQSFDSFYLRHPNKTYKFLQGEYFYHVLTGINLNRPWSFINNWKELKEGDAFILSVPFCDTGNQVFELDEMFNHCSLHNIPVLLDCAYFTIASNIVLNLNHQCIDTVAFSLSKTFPVAHARIGMRYTRPQSKDGQKLHSKINYDNRVSAAIGLEVINNFKSDFIVNKYQTAYNRFVNLLNLTPGNSIMFADGDASWEEYGRKGLLEVYGLNLDYTLFKNRICLTSLLEQQDLVNHALDTL